VIVEDLTDLYAYRRLDEFERVRVSAPEVGYLAIINV